MSNKTSEKKKKQQKKRISVSEANKIVYVPQDIAQNIGKQLLAMALMDFILSRASETRNPVVHFTKLSKSQGLFLNRKQHHRDPKI